MLVFFLLMFIDLVWFLDFIDVSVLIILKKSEVFENNFYKSVNF